MPIQYLQQELLPLLKDSNNFTDPATGIVNTRLMAYLDNWFDKLTGGGTNADKFRRLRLATCIAIDIKSGNFTAQDYLRVFQNFDSLPPEPENVFENFDNAIFETFKRPFSNHSTNDKVEYARVMTFKSYENNYLKGTSRAAITDSTRKKTPLAKNATKYRNLDFDNTKTWADYFLNTDKQVPFKTINPTLTMRAGNDWAWITPKDELEKAIKTLKQTGEEHIGQVIALRLGLVLEKLEDFRGKTYIYFEYPPNFNEVVYQPTAILAKGWQRVHGFVSFKKEDCYGRTFDFSGLKPNFKERIHHGFPVLNYCFKAYVVGSRNETVDAVNDMMSEASQKRIYEEAVERFKAI
jgi:hypothetical protein